MKKYLLMAWLLATAGNMIAKAPADTLTVTTLPQMHCQNCENKIKSNLRFEKGIKSIETSVPNQTVTVKYNADKTTIPFF